MAFSEALFPLQVSAWAVGGRGYYTTVVRTYGGNEFRNSAWTNPLGEWDVTEALRSTRPGSAYSIAALRAFLMAGQGMRYGFRFRDPQDNTDEGGGIFVMLTATTFQMYKQYSITSLNTSVIIQKPVNPVVITGGVVSSVDYTTGIVTMTSGTPTSWAGTFDIPARFAEDVPHIGLDNSTGALWNWQQLKIVEIRDIS